MPRAVRALASVSAAGAFSVSVACVSVVGVSVVGASPASAAGPVPVPVHGAASDAAHADPSSWSDRRLARQLTFTGVAYGDVSTARRHASGGFGGITFFGTPATVSPRAMRAVERAAPHGVAPFLASDEEGGLVQRLRRAIGPLPDARTMGRWSDARVRTTARDYGRQMRARGLTMSFGPVADLAVPGRYIAAQGRAFSSRPATVARKANAWWSGMRAADVVPVVKHWPGHGRASNTHTEAARVAPREAMERRDMVPFDRALAAGVPAVMVGHLQVPGLTKRDVPASLSPRALRVLRARADGDVLVVTDSLSMAAASSALGLSPATAAVRALRAGADVALVAESDPYPVARAVERALRSGSLPREQAETSARRILRAKAAAGLVTGQAALGFLLPELAPERARDPRPGPPRAASPDVDRGRDGVTDVPGTTGRRAAPGPGDTGPDGQAVPPVLPGQVVPSRFVPGQVVPVTHRGEPSG